MTLESFFFICFGVGLSLSAISFLAGSLHLHFPTKLHLGHLHMRHLGTDISPLNVPSMMAFLAWFGGVGYLMTHHYHAGLAMSLFASITGGLLGGAIVFWFLAKLISFDGSLDPDDFHMVGVIGKLSTSIRKDGTGELIYEQAGTRRVCGARCEDGSPLSKGDEVVVTRYERGIAYVRHWDEFAEQEQILSERRQQ